MRTASPIGADGHRVLVERPATVPSSYGDVEWVCPMHGYVKAIDSPQGLRCTADDPDTRYGICDRLVGGPARIAATGELLKDIGKDAVEAAKDKAERFHVSPPRKRKEGTMPRKQKPPTTPPGRRNCRVCDIDMAGEHTRALTCTACREGKGTKPPAPPPPKEDEIDVPVVRRAEEEKAPQISLLERIALLEDQVERLAAAVAAQSEKDHIDEIRERQDQLEQRVFRKAG